MRVGVLGSGEVGTALSQGFLNLGYDVMRGSRTPEKLMDWKDEAGSVQAQVGTFAEAAQFGDLVVFAIKGTAAEEVAKSCAAYLKNKTVWDTTNPISDEEPTDGVLKFFTTHEESLHERLQKIIPEANFIKAFNSVGSPLMVNPDFGDIAPSMFICGNNVNAKSQSREIITQLGWETEDMGTSVAARAIEPLCMLWCIPGFTKNDWNHAFKILR